MCVPDHSDYLGSAPRTEGQPGPAEDLHAAVVIRQGDTEGLERLCRYVLRPPLARTRLHRRPDGLLVLTLRKPYADGTTDFVFSEVELAQKLAALARRRARTASRTMASLVQDTACETR